MFEIPIIKTLTLGPLHFQIWGIMVGLGIFVGYLLTRLRFKQRGLPLKHLENIIVLITLSGIIGARLLWVLIDYQNFLKDPLSAFKIWEGGMAFTGGFLLALLSLWIYLKYYRLKFWKVADSLAVPLVAGMAIGRIGCLLTGLHTGLPTTFGPVFNIEGNTYLAWPAYAIVNWIIAFFVLSQIEKKWGQKWKTGTLSHLVLIWWGLWRFGADFLRSSDVNLGGDARLGELTPTQYLAILVVALVVMDLLRSHNRNPSQN